ncbi:unnamed protein product, partial [Brassica napus]
IVIHIGRTSDYDHNVRSRRKNAEGAKQQDQSVTIPASLYKDSERTYQGTRPKPMGGRIRISTKMKASIKADTPSTSKLIAHGYRKTVSTSKTTNVLCVICQEAPHNVILMRCSSSSTGCRAYMCDMSVRHSNCLKQYRKKNMNRVTKLKNHLKADHPSYTQPFVDQGRERAWEQMHRASEYNDISTEAGLLHSGLEVLHQQLPDVPPRLVILLWDS